MELEDSALDLIRQQVAIVRRLQLAIREALDRNDSGSAQRLIDSCDKASSTLIQGLTAMAIDVSNLKNLFKTEATSTDVIQSLGDRVSQLEQKVGQGDAATVAQLQSDVAEIKTALEELNSSAAATPPTTPSTTPTT